MGWVLTPEVVKEGHYNGKVVVKFPGVKERQNLFKEMKINLDVEIGKMSLKDAVEKGHKVIEIGMKYIESVELVSTRDEEIKAGSVEDIEGNPELVGIFAEVGNLILNGVQLPKKSEKESEPK